MILLVAFLTGIGPMLGGVAVGLLRVRASPPMLRAVTAAVPTVPGTPR